jgi:hypothetical protein
MKLFKTITLVLLLTIGNSFFNGWVWSLAYELGFAPFFSQFMNMPDIPYLMFVLLTVAWSVVRFKSTGDKDAPAVDTPAFWTKYIGIIITDLLRIGVLYLFNIMIL